ncbi:centromere protein I [Syngnathoides biaculeatus]|uniref:centromere protein I n=1 Tax=Syngnathoides biaculeatus TaxID=300417 RepID=UPI002ADD6B83|nr:centromere protein I [Syngnathoides biaculeatus]XP_061691718.1 centromere protein I [Syngnathoides biaculeatus]
MAATPYLSESSDSNKTSSSDQSLSNRSSNRSRRVAEKERRKHEAEDPFVLAVKYFSDVEAGTPIIGNDAFEGNLVVVEKAAYSKGLPPHAIAVMLEFAMSLRMGTSLCPRVLKCLIPATVVPQEAVVRAIAWLGVSTIPINTQVLFIKWVLTVFDMIDTKDQLRAIYGFIFSFVTEENLCPFICHLLFLLTTKHNVRVFRVRKLLDLQTKLGRQPFLLHLLSLYKVFCPELVTLSIPSRMRSGFRNHNLPWKSALAFVQKNNAALVGPHGDVTLTVRDQSNPRQKRKRRHLELPVLSCAVNKESQTELSFSRKLVPLAQLRTFAELLENMHRIELPAQMGSLLSTSVALHYLECVQEESALLRLNYWLGCALQEEFLFCRDGGASQSSDEVLQFLDTLLSAHQFLQEGFSTSEGFLYKFLTIWDGCLMRPQILGLLSNIPVVPSDQMRQLLLEPLKQLYFTSSPFFKCGLLECLNGMLRNWLTWHSVYTLEDDLDMSVNSHASMSMTFSGFQDSVLKLVQFVGHLASVGLQVEGCHALLLNFILEFYETVCEIFLKYSLPVFLIPPPGVFYPALVATDPVSVDRLAFIMHRYKVNMVFAKSQEKLTKAFRTSRQTLWEFNHYVIDMVNLLWNGKMFQSGVNMQLDEGVLQRSNVPEASASFDLIHHPAFMGYAVDFHRKCWPEREELDLHSLKHPKPWRWYAEYLFSQGYDGLQLFTHTNTNRRLPLEGGKDSGAA